MQASGCVVISGPGLLNALVGIAQAKSDSVPMIVLSSAAARSDPGFQRGNLHELVDQVLVVRSSTMASHTILDNWDITSKYVRINDGHWRFFTRSS